MVDIKTSSTGDTASRQAVSPVGGERPWPSVLKRPL